MNGGLSECVVCDSDPCRCSKVDAGLEASIAFSGFEASTNKLYRVLIRPKRNSTKIT